MREAAEIGTVVPFEHEPQTAWESLMTWDDGSPGVYEGGALIDAPFGEGEAEPEIHDDWDDAEVAYDEHLAFEEQYGMTKQEFYELVLAEKAKLEAEQRERAAALVNPAPRQAYQKKPIPTQLRWAVFRRDDYRCVLCGCDEDLTADHIFPEVKGGQATISNLRTLCRPCNSRKGAR